MYVVTRGVQQQEFGLCLLNRLIARPNRLLHDELVDRIFSEAWTSDYEHFERLEIEVSQDGGVDLGVEAGVCLL